MKSVVVVAVVLGALAVGFGLVAVVGAVMRARARRLGLRTGNGAQRSGGPANQPGDWVYFPWSKVPPHHLGHGHHGGPGQVPPGGHAQPGGHHGGHGDGGMGDMGGGGHHHG